MKQKILRKLCVMLLAIITGSGCVNGVRVFAKQTENRIEKSGQAATVNGVVDLGKGKAGIKIHGNANQTLKGKEFCVYQLFHAENALAGESIQYTFDTRYQDVLKKVIGAKLSKPAKDITEYMVIDYMQTFHEKEQELRYFIEEIRNEIKTQGIAGDVVYVVDVKNDNSIEIRGLPYGYYIVDEISKVEGTHSAASLCMVNTASPDADIHVKSDYPSVEKKIREDDAREEIGADGWNDIADFEIGQTVPYRYISDVPDMSGYDTYYFAWHDRMDPELTFRPDTVVIELREKEGARTYKLDSSEFRINMTPGEEETFCVEIPDLKSIVKREMKESRNPKIVLWYDAVLNDKAAEDTGRPGFENSVRLEFSNNPDSDGDGSTGKTPWDTVVCFTYRLDGLKKNDREKVLADARFRLYSDEACTEEVYVKKMVGGYVVVNRDSVGGSDHTGGTVPEGAVEIISDAEGVFRICGLDAGMYWLKETAAPAGYRPLLDPIRIEVRPAFTEERNQYVKGDGATDKILQKLEYHVYIKQFLSGIFEEDTFRLETDAEEGSGNLSVINQIGRRLPGTGSSMMLLLVAAGVGISVVALKKTNKKRYV